MISNKDLRVEDGNLIINGEKHPLDPAVNALIKRANTVQGKLSALGTKITAIEALEKTASGNPISITGAAAAYAMSNIMTIEPIQSGSGDPSPTNVRPISGLTSGEVTRTGKNMLEVTAESQTIEGVTFTINDDGTIQVTGTNSYSRVIRLLIGSVTLASGTYTISTGNPTGAATDTHFLNIDPKETGSTGNENIFTSYTFTDSATTTHKIYIYVRPGQTVNALYKPMIEIASTATPYEPYTAATATITFGQTVYGGSVNFKTGEVTVTHGIVDLGSLNWVYNSSGGFSSDTLTDIKTGLCELVCSGLSFYSDSFMWGDIANIPNYSIAKNAGNKDLYIKDTDYTNATAFKTAMSGVQLCYELATPTTLTLTPAELELLKGNNTISGNGVNINIGYIGR